MKLKILLLSCIVFSLYSCSTSKYYQIWTVASENVPYFNKSYHYEDSTLIINYDFWKEGGLVAFTIANKGDNDLYIDMESTFFIKNREAFDYYKCRTYTQIQNGINYGFDYNDITSVSAEEKKVICIPAHSYKTFGEYTISSIAYRECGLPRNPYPNEAAIKTFNTENTPITFTNRLCIINKGIKNNIENSFYIREIENVSSSVAFDEKEVSLCNGETTTSKYNRYCRADRFYIEYVVNNSITDRVAEVEPVTDNDTTEIPDRVIKRKHFQNISSHTITIPNDINKVNSYAFYNCPNLHSIWLGENIKSFGDKEMYEVFYKCPNLREIHIKSMIPPTLTRFAFYDLHEDCKIFVPKGALETYRKAQYYDQITIVEEAE